MEISMHVLVNDMERCMKLSIHVPSNLMQQMDAYMEVFLCLLKTYEKTYMKRYREISMNFVHTGHTKSS